MEFRMYTPAPVLQPFVQCYLEADSSATKEKGEHALFPNGLSGIFLNFGNMGRLIIKEDFKTPKVSVFGQIDRHFTVVHWPGFYSLGVLFKPSVLSRLLRADMDEFTNRAFDGRLIQKDLYILHERVEEAASIIKKIQVIEQYLLKALASLSRQSDLTEHALHLIHYEGIVNIEKIARQLQVSQRHLEKQFKKNIGLSPKTYALINRFKRMESELRQMPGVHWRDMTFAMEYFDQNHFIKDFKRFTGLTPSDYLTKNLAMGRSYLATS